MLESPHTPTPNRLATRILFVIAFYGALALGPLMWAFAETAESELHPWPEWRTNRVLNGAYTRELERHLEHTSPITSFLRTRFHEFELITRTFESSLVSMRPGAWNFLRETLDDPTARAENAQPARREFLALVRQRMERDGLRIIAAIAPDKSRVYPEFAFEGGEVPEARRGLYRQAVEDLREAGIVVLDLENEFRRYRRSGSGELLYFRRDSHWSFCGASRAALAIVRELRGLERDLGPLLEITSTLLSREWVGSHQLSVVGIDEPSAITSWISDPVEKMHPVLVDRSEGYEDSRRTDAVFVCGDSFAEAGVEAALPILLSRGVDARGVRAGDGPVAGLLDTLARLDPNDPRELTIVWVFIERCLYARSWWEASNRDDILGR